MRLHLYGSEKAQDGGPRCLEVWPSPTCRHPPPLPAAAVSVTRLPWPPSCPAPDAGLLFDRNWVVVRAATGKFVTQRQRPRLALVEVSITPEQLLQGAEISACPDAKLVLRAPGMEQLEVRAVGGATCKHVPLAARQQRPAFAPPPASLPGDLQLSSD